MANSEFIPVSGMVQSIEQVYGQCCQQLVSILTSNGIINFIIFEGTYIENNFKIVPGINITAFYDSLRPVPLIFPPQYQAIAIVRTSSRRNVKLSYFNDKLVAVDNSLKLNISRDTEILTSKGQKYFCSLEDKLLLVYYGSTTKSIPPQTTPDKVVVIC